ncbi:hypothetical protein, partial [Candidatus Brocadia sapporoensis]|uniref:hypothetical protein n=1 Tax=Candidatus Brocadia sapporoensis TaxID=392547 RepID=UPI001E4171CC
YLYAQGDIKEPTRLHDDPNFISFVQVTGVILTNLIVGVSSETDHIQRNGVNVSGTRMEKR